jgi:hypothetical protein
MTARSSYCFFGGENINGKSNRSKKEVQSSHRDDGGRRRWTLDMHKMRSFSPSIKTHLLLLFFVVFFVGQASAATTVLDTFTSDLSNYAGQTGSFGINNSFGYDDTNSLEKTGADAWESIYSTDGEITSSPVNISCRIYYTGSERNRGGCGLWSSDGSGGYIAYFQDDINTGVNQLILRSMSDTSSSGSKIAETPTGAFTLNDDTWYKIVLEKNQSTYTTWLFDGSGNKIAGSIQATDSSYSVESKAFLTYDSKTIMDYYVRETPSSNSKPEISNINPSNGEKNVNDTVDSSPVDVNVSFDVSDSDGDSMNVTLNKKDGTILNSWTGVTSGTTLNYVWENLSSGTTYNWQVEATDGNDGTTTAGNYSFTTSGGTADSAEELWWWRLNESSSPTVDYFGNNPLGSWSGGVTTDVSGISKSQGEWGDGEAVTFDGSDDEMVANSGKRGNDVFVENAVTYSFWMKASSLSQSQTYVLSNLGNTSASGEATILFEYVDDTLEFHTGTAGTRFDMVQVNDTNWHHYAVSYNATSQEGRVYYEGSLVKTVSGSSGFGDSAEADTLALGSSDGGNYFAGSVDEFKAYTDVLSSQQVKNLYETNNENLEGSVSKSPEINSLKPSDGFYSISNTTDDSYVDVILEANVSDPNSESLDVEFNWQNGTSIHSAIGVSNNSVVSYKIQNLSFDTQYNWYVNVSDGENYTVSSTRSFTTRDFFDKDAGTWTRSDFNPTIPSGDTGDWDEANAEGASGIYRDDTGKYYVAYWGGSDGSQEGIGIASTDNLREGQYNKLDCNPVINPSYEVQDPSIIDDRDDSGNFYMYVSDVTNQQNHVYKSTDNDLCTWTDTGKTPITSSFASANVLNIGEWEVMAWMSGNKEDFNLAYSKNGEDFTQDANNPVLSYSDWSETQAEIGTPVLFTTNSSTGSDTLHMTTEIKNSNGYWRGYLAEASLSSVLDGSNSSTWTVDNQGEPVFLTGDSSITWENSTNVAEMKTFYFPNADAGRLYTFHEGWKSTCTFCSQLGTAWTSIVNVDSQDTTSPSITIYTPSEGETVASSIVDLNVTSSETIDNWDYSLDGGSNQSFTPNTTLSDVSGGSHTLEVYASDGNGNVGSESVSFTVYDVNSTVFGLEQDGSKSSDTGTQYLVKWKELENLGSNSISGFDVSDPSIPGSCSNCGKSVDLSGGEVKNLSYNSSGDWISGEKAYTLDNASNSVEYGAFQTNYSSDQDIEVTNDRTDIGLSVKLDPVIPGHTECVVSSGTEFLIGDGATENNSITKSCDPGDESDYSLVKSTGDNLTTYEYNGTVEVYSDRTDEVEHEYWVEKSRFTDFSNKDASSVNYSIDDVEDGMDVSVKSRDGSDYLVWTAYTNRTNSSVHQGTHYFTYEYSVSDSDSDDGGSTGGTGGSGGGNQEEVTESPYDWSLTLVESEFVGVFKPTVRPGESFEREIVVESGESDLKIDIGCESSGNACEWVSADVTSVEFDDSGQTVVTVRGQVPEDAVKNSYRFNMVFTDPAHEEGSSVGKNTVRFVVSTDSPWDFVFDYWDNLTGSYNGVPIAFFGFFMSMIFLVPAWALGRLEDYPKVVPTVGVLIFLITVGII